MIYDPDSLIIIVEEFIRHIISVNTKRISARVSSPCIGHDRIRIHERTSYTKRRVAIGYKNVDANMCIYIILYSMTDWAERIPGNFPVGL